MLKLFKVTLSSELNRVARCGFVGGDKLGVLNRHPTTHNQRGVVEGKSLEGQLVHMCLPQDAIIKNIINISVNLSITCWRFELSAAFMWILHLWTSGFLLLSDYHYWGWIVSFHSQKGRFHRLFLSFALACRFIVAMSLFSYKVQCYYCRTDILM